jgi:formate transporter
VLQFEQLQEPFRGDEALEPLVDTDDGDAPSTAPSSRTSRRLEIGLRRNQHGFLRDVGDGSLVGRGQQPLDRNDAAEACLLEQDDLGDARKPPTPEHRPNISGTGSGCSDGDVEDGGLLGGALEALDGAKRFGHALTLARQADARSWVFPSGYAATNRATVSERVFTPAGLDALPPLEMARKAEQVGVVKADMSVANTLALSVLAGAFIALGAIFATTVTAGGADLPFGVLRLLGGLAFSLGLILVIVAGAELFTGNNLIVMAWASRRVRTAQVARNWALVYLGNFAGALATAGILFVGKQYELGEGAVGVQAVSIAASKTSLGFVQAIALGAFCNGLVCLAVWLCYSARTTADKILSIVPPIAAFVAAGFEHSVANMFFIPMGLLVKGDEAFVSDQEGLPTLTDLTWERFVTANLVPVTIGNVVGGAVMVGAIYWFVYLRRTDDVPSAQPLTSDDG